jgi:hypothetical protein
LLDDADRIWNRACDPFARLSTSGDRALQAALLVHGQVMNGGLLSALDYIDYDQIERGADGFEDFGLSRGRRHSEDRAASRVPRWPDAETQALDYAACLYRDRPNDFTPA